MLSSIRLTAESPQNLLVAAILALVVAEPDMLRYMVYMTGLVEVPKDKE